MLERNAAAIAQCYAHAEGGLFVALKKLLVKYQPWVAVGALDDVDDHVATRVREGTVECFEGVAAELKAVGRELQRSMPNEVQVCFDFSTFFF